MNLRIFFISFLTLLVIVGTLIGWSSYGYYVALHSDDPVTPTLSVEEWSASVIRGETAYDMGKWEKFDLVAGDAIETRASSRAAVTWPDRSITRIGANSRIVIQKMYASTDYQKIEIAYDMKRGKVWNTVIRTLIGDSYFEARLPKNNIVAWVRGTTFEVNLDSGYIHAVDHAMHLSDISGWVLTLLPGDIVDSENIWVKKWKELLDTAWWAYNNLQDAEFQKARLESVRKRIDTLGGQLSTWNPLETITRWFLSHFAKFRNIKISELLTNEKIEWLTPDIKNALLPYYQSLGGKWLEKEREVIRGYMMDAVPANIKNNLERQSLWDSIDTGNVTKSARDLLEKGGIDTSKLGQDARETTKKLLESLSGSLGNFGF
jgi:hypothetical protein